ncbi:Uncharacterised protein [BD1-7 clade bacterium]|uniref:DUF3592 domain-containing protein n=1 Tax=BD1-7 clade bacterium TaxID=2029982 RepID=A0A5S9N6H2_9GAMM|nr:Uncharacterised protein [BD1-7 clade bacterium]CAA0083609.1 Uncharacterised protein [BD1-7 clade bacterium]
MTNIPSPWGRWRRHARWLAGIVTIAATLIGCLFFRFATWQPLDWPTQVDHLYGEVVQLRSDFADGKHQGAGRRQEEFYLVYRFHHDDVRAESGFVSRVRITEKAYRSYQVGGHIPLVVSRSNPSLNDTFDNYQRRHSWGNTLLSVLPFSLVGGLLFYFMLMYFSLKTHDDIMHEGFYTEHSWLDVEQRQVVFLHRGTLYYFDIDPKQIDKVRRAYQRGVDCNSLRLLSHSSYFRDLPLEDITRLSTSDRSRQLDIAYQAERHAIRFMNQAHKKHALEQIKHYLPDYMAYEETDTPIWQAGLPCVFAILVLITVSAVLQTLVGYAVCGGIIVAILLPRLLMTYLTGNRRRVWANQQAQGIVI